MIVWYNICPLEKLICSPYFEWIKWGQLLNTSFPLLRFCSALRCGYSGITDIQDGLFFVLTRARTFKEATVRCAIANSKIFAKTFNIFIRGHYLYQ
jgi:hypothetical protein